MISRQIYRDGWMHRFYLRNDGTLKIHQFNAKVQTKATIQREIHIWGDCVTELKELLNNKPPRK